MTLIIFKYATTAFIIVLVSEIAKRSGKIGALISSLPTVTILVMIWMFIENQENKKIADYAYYTLWYVLPSLPMFGVMPFMLNRGFSFWFSLIICILVTFICFIITAYVGKIFGVDLIP
jgi:hypothetical protein